MKMFFLIAWIVIGAVSASGQTAQVERDFESKKAKFTFEHFAEGEDASSGFDYLFYKSGEKIVKVRAIWSASHSKELKIDDFYFNGTDIVLVRKFTAADRLLNSLKKGRNAVMVPKEEFHFSAGKLTKWIADGKVKTPGDAGWEQAEKEGLERATSQREYYGWLKEGKS